MSYRTYVNGHQVFGNNEYYQEWFDFLKSKGVYVGDEYNYDCYLTDFMEAIEVCEKIVMRLEADRTDHMGKYHSLFDLSYIKEKVLSQEEDESGCLFDELRDLIEYGYLFIPIVFYQACKEDLEYDFENTKRFIAYKLKEGCKIHVHAD